MSIITTVRTAAFTVALGASVAADVIVVTPSGSGDEIQTAVDAAIDGDLILVEDGTYTGFVLDGKALTITADAGATVTITTTTAVRHTTRGQQVALADLTFLGGGLGRGLDVRDCQGAVMIDRCSAVGDAFPFGSTPDGIGVEDCSAVTIVDCAMSSAATGSFSDAGAGLDARSSRVDVWHSTLTGGTGLVGNPSGAGASVAGGVVTLTSCSLTGGTGGFGDPGGLFTPCSDGVDGAPALSLTADDPLVRLRDCVLAGGPGGPALAAECVDGQPGPQQAVAAGHVASVDADATVAFDVTSPIRERQTATLSWTGSAGDVVWVAFGFTHEPTFVHAAAGPFAIGAPATSLFMPVALDGTGSLALPVDVPATPGTDSFELYLQGVFWNPTDGLLVGNPRVGVVLDESL